MAIGRRAAVPRQPDTPSDKANIPELTDAQLLERFVARRDEEAERAFGELLARHGPMVLGVCRRMLRDVHSADDAFQAAFLVLVRRAGSVRGESLGPWLHGVTYHVASRARALAARRRERDGVNIDQWEAPVDEPDRVELRAIVDEEVHRLPEAYRAAAVLCYLAGHTHEEAAVRLRCPVGTVKSRLSRARDLLRARLNRRGLALTAGVLTSALVAEAAPVAVPAKLAGSTTRAATRLAGGKAATEMGVSSSVAGAAEATLGDLISARLKVAGIVLLAAGVVATVAIRPGRHADGAGGPVAAARPVSAQAIAGTAGPGGG
jgi:RNA polymerase sigma factor (sigma-70 family)